MYIADSCMQVLWLESQKPNSSHSCPICLENGCWYVMADHGGSMWPHVLLSSKSCRVCWINLNILYLLLDKDCRSAYPQDIAHGLQPRELAASRNCMRLLSCTSLQKILHSKSIIWLHQRVHPRHIKHCFLCPS